MWLWIVLGVILFIVLVLFGVGFAIWYKAIPTPKPEKYQNRPTDDPVEVAIRDFREKTVKSLREMKMEEVWIKSKDGLDLHAYYKEAMEKTNKTVISVHGWHGSALGTAPIFSHFLTEYNYNILFIDLRSYGESGGKYTTYGVKDSEDLLEWIEYLKDRTRGDVSIALFGISMGGNTVIEVADKVPLEVKCIIDDCGFTSAYDQFHYMLKELMHIPTFFLFFAELINKMVNKWGFMKGSGERAVEGSKVPILFIHGEDDTFVPTEFGERLYKHCNSEKELKVFEKTAHARSYYLNKEGYKTVVLAFLAKKL